MLTSTHWNSSWILMLSRGWSLLDYGRFQLATHSKQENESNRTLGGIVPVPQAFATILLHVKLLNLVGSGDERPLRRMRQRPRSHLPTTYGTPDKFMLQRKCYWYYSTFRGVKSIHSVAHLLNYPDVNLLSMRNYYFGPTVV